MKTERVTFKNADGIKLAAKLELPVDRRPHNFAVFAHCFTCNMNLKAIKNIADGLTSAGFGVLRFDFTGLGMSEGEFADSNFSSQVSDITHAVKWLEENYRAPALLVGHSLGGTAALLAGTDLESVRAMVSVGSPAEPEHVKHLFREDLKEIEKMGAAEVNIGGRGFRIKHQFIKDITSRSLLKKLEHSRKPLLIMHSPQDSIVGISEAEKIYQAAFHPKSFVSLDGADHLLSKKEDAQYAGQVIAAWAARFVEKREEKLPDGPAETIARIGGKSDKYTTQVKMGKHHLVADEPETLGGFDLGPTPYDLLKAALGACTTMTLRMYADHKKIDLSEVTVHLRHEKRHLKDADVSEGKGKKMDHIDRIIEIDGDLTDAQRKRMLQIADKCPVHKTLKQSVIIHSKLKE
ncbi:MAG: alpha/beta fold hydrolase [Saprospirales bacterium]|nr:MAG: alpha/beta fold hydrolase [Saprospirales bacterium]